MVRWLAAAVAASLLVVGAAAARPFTVDDVLKHETLGPALVDPTGQRGVVEVVPAHDTLRDFSMYATIERRPLSKLSWFDTTSPGELHQILPEKDADVVYLAPELSDVGGPGASASRSGAAAPAP